jgi:hypothetical protein
MNNKIKIGEPHFYYKLRTSYKILVANLELLATILIVLATMFLVIKAFIAGDTNFKLMGIAMFFASTTFLLIMMLLSKGDK